MFLKDYSSVGQHDFKQPYVLGETLSLEESDPVLSVRIPWEKTKSKRREDGVLSKGWG